MTSGVQILCSHTYGVLANEKVDEARRRGSLPSPDESPGESGIRFRGCEGHCGIGWSQEIWGPQDGRVGGGREAEEQGLDGKAARPRRALPEWDVALLVRLRCGGLAQGTPLLPHRE